MRVLITGGSKCGKSSFVEKLISENCKGELLYYLATMKVYGKEGLAIVERHRKMREGRGFITIEQERDINEAVTLIKNPESTVLLECLTNLVANEMFEGETPKSAEEIAGKVFGNLELLSKSCKNLFVVTNNVFDDGGDYGDTTLEYIRAMGIIHQRLVREFDNYYELVAGIPLKVK